MHSINTLVWITWILDLECLSRQFDHAHSDVSGTFSLAAFSSVFSMQDALRRSAGRLFHKPLAAAQLLNLPPKLFTLLHPCSFYGDEFGLLSAEL